MVRPSDSVRAIKPSQRSLSHAYSCNALADSSRPKSPSAAGGRRIENTGETPCIRSRFKNSKFASSLPRLIQKEYQHSAEVCDNRLLDESSSGASTSITVPTKASRKITATVFSGSDIDRTLTSEVKSGKMSKDLASLVISLSREESPFLPLPKRKAVELRNWILSADSGCSKLPLSIRNHLNYVIQISDDACSTSKKSINLEISKVGSGRNVQTSSRLFNVTDKGKSTSNLSTNQDKLKSKLSHTKDIQFQRDSCCGVSRKLGKSARNDLTDRRISSKTRSFLKDETGQQKFSNDDDDIRRRAPRKPSASVVVSRSVVARNQQKMADSNERGKRSVVKKYGVDAKKSLTFAEEAQSVVKKINHNLQSRRMLRNSSSLKLYKSAPVQKPTSKLRRLSNNDKRCPVDTELHRHKLLHSVSSSTTEDDAVTSSGISKMVHNRNFGVRSHLQKIAQQKVRTTSSGPEFHSSATNLRGSVTRVNSTGSWRSRGSLTRRNAALKKRTSMCASRKFSLDGHSSGSARTPESVTRTHVLDSCSSTSAAYRPLSHSSSSTGKNMTSTKVCQGVNNNTSRVNSRNKQAVSVMPTTAKNVTSSKVCQGTGINNNINSRKKPAVSLMPNAGKNVTSSKVCQDVNSNTSRVTSRNKPAASVMPNTACNKKVITNCKEVSAGCKSPQRPLVHSSKVSGRWSDLGSWNGQVYTIKRVTSSSEPDTQPKSDNDKHYKKKAQLPLKPVTSNSNNKRTSKEIYQQANDKSSVETVISCVTSKPKPSLDSDVHTSTSVSSVEKQSPRFEVQMTTYQSDTECVALKRHVKKPPLSNLESSPSKRIPSCSTSSDRKVLEKRTHKTAMSSVSSNVKLEEPPVLSSVSDESVEDCSTTAKKTVKPADDQQHLCGISDAESAVSDLTFVAENRWHFGVPPQSWLGSWSLSAANGSRSSLNTETDKEEECTSDDTLSVISNDRCTVAKIASFDKAVSTDSEPELSTTKLTTEALDKYPEEPKNGNTLVSQSDNDKHFEHSFIVDADDVFNPNLEDIQLEPIPSGIFCLSSTDVAEDVMSGHEECINMRDDERSASSNSSGLCVLNDGVMTAENDVFVVDSWKHFDDNVNNVIRSSSSSSPLFSDVQDSDSRKQSSSTTYSHSLHTMRVSSSKSATAAIRSSSFSDRGSNTLLSRSNRSPFTHGTLATCAGWQYGRSSNNKMAAGSSISKSNDVRAKTVNVKREQRASKFRADFGRYVNKVTLVSSPYAAAKDMLDSNRNWALSDQQMTLEASQSDTGHVLLSNCVPDSDIRPLNIVAEDVISDNEKLWKEPAKNTNRSSNPQDSESSSNAEVAGSHKVPGCHDINMLTSSSGVSEHADTTSASGSLADVSTAVNTTSSSDSVMPKIGPRCHVSGNCSASSDVNCTRTESTAINSVDGDQPQCTCTSADTTTGRADHTPDCGETCCRELELDGEECALNEDELTTGADIYFDEIPNADSDAFMAGLNEVERYVSCDTEWQRLCQSVDELPARSRRLTTDRNTPVTDIFTRQSVSGFDCDERRNSWGFHSARKHHRISNLCGIAAAQESEKKSPRDICVHLCPENDGCYESSDDDSVDNDDYFSSLRLRNSLSCARPHKVKVNCKSSYIVKSRRQYKNGRRAAPIKSARETGSSETDGDRMCSYSSPPRNFDSVQNENVCQEVKRVSCSQLYRMSRAGQGHMITQPCPMADCTTGNDVCVSQMTDKTSPKDAWKEVEPTAVLASKQSDSVDFVASRQTADVVDIVDSSELLHHQEKTIIPGVSQVERRERTDSVDFVASRQTADIVDTVDSRQLLRHQQKTIPSVSRVESRGASEEVVKKVSKASDANAESQEIREDNSNQRPKSPSIPDSYDFAFTDNTESSPSISFSINPTTATEMLSDDKFLEVLSSRLLNVIAKKQQQSQSPVSDAERSLTQQATLGVNSATTAQAIEQTDSGDFVASHQSADIVDTVDSRELSYHAALEPELVNCPAMNSYSVGVPRNRRGYHDCDNTALGSEYRASGKTPGVEGYLQRSEAAADCSEWTRHPTDAEIAAEKQGLTELQTAINNAATGYEVR